MKDADGDDLELTPFGRHLVAIIGCAMFVLGSFLTLRAAANLPAPFPIWEILLAMAGTVVIITADPTN
jgi:hypothetical protein